MLFNRYNKSYINYIKWNYQIKDILKIADISCFIVTIQDRSETSHEERFLLKKTMKHRYWVTVNNSNSNKDKTTFCQSRILSLTDKKTQSTISSCIGGCLKPSYYVPPPTLTFRSCLQATCAQIWACEDIPLNCIELHLSQSSCRSMAFSWQRH